MTVTEPRVTAMRNDQRGRTAGAKGCRSTLKRSLLVPLEQRLDTSSISVTITNGVEEILKAIALSASRPRYISRLFCAALLAAAIRNRGSLLTTGFLGTPLALDALADIGEIELAYGTRFGLCSFDRETFARTPKPSARVLGGIARRNAI